jgi:hypothetical protein
MVVVDLLHEFELGIWKAVFSHLIRILESVDPNLVDELNARYPLLSAFMEVLLIFWKDFVQSLLLESQISGALSTTPPRCVVWQHETLRIFCRYVSSKPYLSLSNVCSALSLAGMVFWASHTIHKSSICCICWLTGIRWQSSGCTQQQQLSFSGS